jgi:voltage-gated potassium channel Kch
MKTDKNDLNMVLLFLVFFTIVVGTLFYRYVENLSFLDAFYFSVITLTTVGYGDIAPQTAVGRIFTVFYILSGIGLIVAFIDNVTKIRIEKRLQKKNKKAKK